jgi:hypothetical protein
MNDPDQRRAGTTAGGSLLALAIVAGAAIGVANGQPTIGALTGLAVGVSLFLLVWLVGRR